MNRFLRAVIALLLLMLSSDVTIRSGILSNIVPSTGKKSQGRSSMSASAAYPIERALGVHKDRPPLTDQPADADKKYFPCESLSITTSGAVCDEYKLNFPEVNLKSVLDGDSYLPHKSTSVFISEKFVHATVYRNIALELRWDPATPSFLQIHLAEYLPYWADRIPYRLFWNTQYEICYESCSSFSDGGEFLPEDIEGLPSSLAADINFNGVPAAFWNENINP